MEKEKRSWRRWLKDKKKKKAEEIYPDYPKAKQLADHLHNCSCRGCGNPRHHEKGEEKLTIKERKYNLDTSDN